MTGPEHYLKAQRLLDFAAEIEAHHTYGSGWEHDQARAVARAQVHASLALVAANVAGAVAAGVLPAQADFGDSWAEAGI